MHNEQVAAIRVGNAVRKWKGRQVNNPRLSNLFACPANSIALLFTFIERMSDNFHIGVALDNWTIQGLHTLQGLFWTWAIQAEITRDDELIDRRLLLQVLQRCF